MATPQSVAAGSGPVPVADSTTWQNVLYLAGVYDQGLPQEAAVKRR